MTKGLVQSALGALTGVPAAHALSAAVLLATALNCCGAEFISLAPQIEGASQEALLNEADDDACCRGGGFWFAGVEATMLQTVVRSGGQITGSFVDTTAPGVATAAFVDGNGIDRFGFAPRIWIGRQITPKWGIVARYWDLTVNDTHAPAGNPAIPNVGTNFATIFETDQARLYTADLEVIRSLAIFNWKIDALGGVRRARVTANSDILSFGVFTTGNFVNLSLQNGFDFDGTGGTGGLFGRRQLGNTPLQFLVGGRFSYLSGHSESFGRVAGTVASSPSAPLVGAATVSRNGAEAQATIGELQTGLQLDWPLASVPASAFFRTTFEYQNWMIHGLPTGGAGFGGTIGELTTNSFASAGLGRAHLLGVSLATGINW